MEWEKEMWSEEMWQIYEGNGSGIIHIEGVPYEYGPVASDEESAIEAPDLWIRPQGKDSPIAYSDIKRDDPRYVNGTKEFRTMIETVRTIHNILNAKGAAVLKSAGFA
jgi:hypothetical protein